MIDHSNYQKPWKTIENQQRPLGIIETYRGPWKIIQNLRRLYSKIKDHRGPSEDYPVEDHRRPWLTFDDHGSS